MFYNRVKYLSGFYLKCGAAAKHGCTAKRRVVFAEGENAGASRKHREAALRFCPQGKMQARYPASNKELLSVLQE